MYNQDKESILQNDSSWLEDKQIYERIVQEELKIDSFIGNICFPEINDIQQLINLEYTCFATDRLSRKEFYSAIKSDKSYFKVVIVQGVIIAYILCALMPVSKRIRIYSICVHPSYRNYKIAHTLIDNAEKYAISVGLNEMYLEVDTENHPAISLYESLGFTPFGSYKRYYDNGNDAVRMKKILQDLEVVGIESSV